MSNSRPLRVPLSTPPLIADLNQRISSMYPVVRPVKVPAVYKNIGSANNAAPAAELLNVANMAPINNNSYG